MTAPDPKASGGEATAEDRDLARVVVAYGESDRMNLATKKVAEYRLASLAAKEAECQTVRASLELTLKTLKSYHIGANVYEQADNALKVIAKDRDEWAAIAKRVDAKMLAEQADHNKTIDGPLAAAKAENQSLRQRVETLEATLTTIADAVDEDDSGLTLRQIQRYARRALSATVAAGKAEKT